METKIFRFKIQNKEFYDKIIDFSNLHKHDDKDSLKENFKSWCESKEILPYIEQEKNILMRNHYDLEKTPIYDKIYKSIKYYHIKNMLKQEDKSFTCTIKRKKNIKFSKSFIQVVKQYLNEHLQDNEFKPSSYYTLFYKENEHLIQSEILNINKENNYNSDFIKSRIKKMFKNQYFTMIHSS